MAEDESTDEADDAGNGDEEKSFRERVEEIRERRSDEEGSPNPMEEAMGGGPGGPGGMGGNPFAQMMGGMMGGMGGPGGPGGMGGARAQGGGDEIRIDIGSLTRELEQLRREVSDATRELERIADTLEDRDD